jgi:hypothetical protein
MTKPNPYDGPSLSKVYFWTPGAGVLELPPSVFLANARTERREFESYSGLSLVDGVSRADPSATYTTDDRPDHLLSWMHEDGLLWTHAPARAESFPCLIPAVVTRIKTDPRTEDGDAIVSWAVTIEWRSNGPFVAAGFSEARTLIEAVTGGARP